jgi:hypothetical protein
MIHQEQAMNGNGNGTWATVAELRVAVCSGGSFPAP